MKIFINYRREDAAAGYTLRLYDELIKRYSPDEVFLDIDNISPGMDFIDTIEEAISSADLLLVSIGKQWTTTTNAAGELRLFTSSDPVRLEISAALERNIPIIPVLFQGTTMPNADHLPRDIKRLTRRQAIEFSDTRWPHDVERLINAIDRALTRDYMQLTIEQLNQIIATPRRLQEKVDAMEAVGLRGLATPLTYRLLQLEAISRPNAISQQELDDPHYMDDRNYIRQAALWTLGMLDKALNSNLPSTSLQSIHVIRYILSDPEENSDVKLAAVQALQVINRPADEFIRALFQRGLKDKDTALRRLCQEGLRGVTIPVPPSAP